MSPQSKTLSDRVSQQAVLIDRMGIPLDKANVESSQHYLKRILEAGEFPFRVSRIGYDSLGFDVDVRRLEAFFDSLYDRKSEAKPPSNRVRHNMGSGEYPHWGIKPYFVTEFEKYIVAALGCHFHNQAGEILNMLQEINDVSGLEEGIILFHKLSSNGELAHYARNPAHQKQLALMHVERESEQAFLDAYTRRELTDYLPKIKHMGAFVLNLEARQFDAARDSFRRFVVSTAYLALLNLLHGYYRSK